MTQRALADHLLAWLPAQRWFAGSGSEVRQIEIRSDIRLAAGDPELRHLMLDVRVGQDWVCYQLLLGLRTGLPADLTRFQIGVMPDGRFAYDAAADSELTAVLLHGIASERRAGRLRFRFEAGAVIDESAPGRPLPALASNTSVVFGDQAILKLLRRPFTGHHPDLEVPAALARRGSKLVAAPLGWIEMDGAGQSTPVQATPVQATPVQATPVQATPVQATEPDSAVLAILSVFFPHSSDGWTLATASLHQPQPDFSTEARLLGAATARLHAQLADAFGTSVLSEPGLTDLVGVMMTELDQAVGVVPALREHEPAIRGCYDRLADPGMQVAVQRIHGDYHLAQVLGTESGWIVLDFEGEPNAPLDRRRLFAPALRDVAGMLRSFDYAARHAALEQLGERRLAETARDWVRRCQDAFCAGYAGSANGWGQLVGARPGAVSPSSHGDPRANGPLLRALILQKAVYEAVYETRHRPSWLPIPLAAIAEAIR